MLSMDALSIIIEGLQNVRNNIGVDLQCNCGERMGGMEEKMVQTRNQIKEMEVKIAHLHYQLKVTNGLLAMLVILLALKLNFAFE